jgi:tetratricopeptide (TPR) repeat protein
MRWEPGTLAFRLTEILKWPVRPSEYDLALKPSRAFQAQSLSLDRERSEALGLFVELMGFPTEQRDLLLRSFPKFQTWGLFELLVERSLEMAVRDAHYAEDLGLLALEVADHLDVGKYWEDLIEDLRARAWAHIGNARRVRSDLQGADEAFEAAYAYLQRGTRDSLERALLLDLKASLRRDQRRFDEAFKLLRRAIDIFMEMGQRHRAGRSLVKMDDVHHHAGHPEEGMPLLFQALELIDPEQEPRLLLCARHNLIDDLAESGRFEEAQALYRETRPLYRDFAEPWVQNRRKWVRGKIARGKGQIDLAEKLFTAAREGFLAEDIPYDTALVSLDLALIYAEQGRTAELKRLAEEMLPIFTSRQIHREAFAAWSFFQGAVESERVSLEVVTRVAGFLRRARHNPEEPFPESA